MRFSTLLAFRKGSDPSVDPSIGSVNELDARRLIFSGNRLLSSKLEQTRSNPNRRVAGGRRWENRDLRPCDFSCSPEQAARGSKEMGKERTEIEAIPVGNNYRYARNVRRRPEVGSV